MLQNAFASFYVPLSSVNNWDVTKAHRMLHSHSLSDWLRQTCCPDYILDILDSCHSKLIFGTLALVNGWHIPVLIRTKLHLFAFRREAPCGSSRPPEGTIERYDKLQKKKKKNARNPVKNEKMDNINIYCDVTNIQNCHNDLVLSFIVKLWGALNFRASSEKLTVMQHWYFTINTFYCHKRHKYN